MTIFSSRPSVRVLGLGSRAYRLKCKGLSFRDPLPRTTTSAAKKAQRFHKGGCPRTLTLRSVGGGPHPSASDGRGPSFLIKLSYTQQVGTALVILDGSFPKLWVPFWGPYIKDYGFFGVYIGVPLFWETTR